MSQLTLRGFDRELERELRRVARVDGISLNQAALKLLRKGAGLSNTLPQPIGAGLDPFLGTLAESDATEVERSVRSADAADLAAQSKARRRSE